MSKYNGVAFITLKIFSATGGIEKVCKVAGKALYELYGDKVQIFSIYDSTSSIDKKYFPPELFKGFSGGRIRFILHAVWNGVRKNCVILSHINLLSVGYIIKKLSPKTKLILYAHGIEVWHTLPGWKIKMLKSCDKILAVSSFTKEKIKALYDIDNKCEVLNNCLDPFLPEPEMDGKLSLYKKYSRSRADFILVTVTRISAKEQYKGHEKVIEAMKNLIAEFPNLRYLVVGKYDLSEKERLNKLILQANLTDHVTFTGYVPEEELALHYSFSDVYIMPSTGEGFGIVFIEAMFYRLPVIAGNKDGSVDALGKGDLGLLVNPLDIEEITTALKKVIINKNKYQPDNTLLMDKFGYFTYRKNLKKMIHEFC